MRNYADYTRCLSVGGAGRPIYVKSESFGLYQTILSNHGMNYHFTTIMRTLYLLNADGHRGASTSLAGNGKSIKSGSVMMEYALHDGAVFIDSLVLTSDTVSSKTGLYKVDYNSRDGRWRAAGAPVEHLGLAGENDTFWNSNGSKAHFAAVAGRFDDKESASHSLASHIIGAYRKADLLTKDGPERKSYSLFWSEKGEHKSKEAAHALVSVMQNGAKNDLAVNWLVHGDGIHTFMNAAKILKASPLASASDRQWNARAGSITKQNVYFSNPASSIGKESLKKMCSDAGIAFLDINDNNHDYFRWKNTKNVGRDMAKKLVATAAAGGTMASISQGAIQSTVSGYTEGFSKALTATLNGLSSGNHIAVACGVVAGGIAVAGLVKKVKPLAAGIHCTFGRGNEKWYTDDKTLLS